MLNVIHEFLLFLSTVFQRFGGDLDGLRHRRDIVGRFHQGLLHGF